MTDAGLIFAAGAFIALVIWVGTRLRTSVRQARLRAIVNALSLRWISTDDKALRTRLASFRLFSSVNASKAYAVLAGQLRGHPVTIFDYDYGNLVNGGFNPYLVLVFDGCSSVPEFWLHPKGSLNSMGTGDTAIPAAFSGLREYVLEGGDPGSGLLAICEELRARGYWPSVAVQDTILIYYEPTRQPLTVELVRRILDHGGQIHETLAR